MKKLLAVLFVFMMAIFMFAVSFADEYVNEVALTDSEIDAMAGSYSGQIIRAAKFKDGLAATMYGDRLGYFVDGEPVQIWEGYQVSDEDFFFGIKGYNPKAGYDLCIMLGNTVYSIRDDLTLRYEVSHVFCYGFGVDYCYFFALSDGDLYYWSPYALVLISGSGVYDMIVNVDYAFFDDHSGGHVINASLRDMNRMNQRYFTYHPLKIIDLGATFWDYYGDMYDWDENGLVDNTAAFNQQFGVDFSVWGNPKFDLTVEDFTTLPDKTVAAIEMIFDSPVEDYTNPLQYDNIYFCGHRGLLDVPYVDEVTIYNVRWRCTNGSVTLTEELKGIVGDRCRLIDHIANTEEGYDEYVYKLNGHKIHVGYQNVIDGSVISYVYTYNPYVTVE